MSSRASPPGGLKSGPLKWLLMTTCPSLPVRPARCQPVGWRGPVFHPQSRRSHRSGIILFRSPAVNRRLDRCGGARSLLAGEATEIGGPQDVRWADAMRIGDDPSRLVHVAEAIEDQ